MEESIGSLCRSLASFSNHLESSCDALTQSLLRRPIPLGSASSTFIQCLNRRVSKVSSELDLLESMTLGTVSFEELLGHCNEVYKSNQLRVLQIQDHLKPFGYVPRELEIDDGDEILDDDDSLTELDVGSKIVSSNREQVSLDDVDLFDESLSLKNIGLSNVCLASLASGVKSKVDELDEYSNEPTKDGSNELMDKDDHSLGLSRSRLLLDFDEVDDLNPDQNLSSNISIMIDDYESLPSYMKGLASWEDLHDAVDKINSNLNQKMSGRNFFHQDEISSLDLGPKARSYLLLLVRMNKLKVETIDGLISYRVL